LTEVINIYYAGPNERAKMIKVDRTSIFGNPFFINKHGNRLDVIEYYRLYFYARLQRDPQFKKEVHKLKDKILGCWCKPLPCHADIIVNYLDNIYKKSV